MTSTRLAEKEADGIREQMARSSLNRIWCQVPRELEKKLQKARKLVADKGFYATALARCPHIWTKQVPTAGMDNGGIMYFNPDWVEPLPRVELAGVVLHELHHFFCDHTGKRFNHPDRKANPLLWNLAADLEINPPIREAGWRLPDGVAYPDLFDFPPNQTAETYFALLMEKAGKSPDQANDIEPLEKDFYERLQEIRDQLLDESSAKELEELGRAGWRETDDAGEEAIQAMAAERNDAKRAGEGSLGMTRLVEDLMNKPPQVDWRKLLRECLKSHETSSTQTAYPVKTYRASDRRFPARRGAALMPGSVYAKPAISNVLVVLDTSASMATAELNLARNEIEGILRRAFKGGSQSGITCYAVDYDVCDKQKVRHINDIPFTGGGGTDMGLGIRTAADEHDWRREGEATIIVLTDGYTPWPDRKPDHIKKVVICLVGEDSANESQSPDWATTIKVK